MTHHCTTCNRQVLHDGTTCCVCAGKGEMPEPDCCGTSPTHDPDIGSYYEWHGWHVGPDGTTSIERYAQAKAAEAERLWEALMLLRPKVLHHDPEYDGQRTNGSMPKWNGMLKMIDNALAGKE